MAETGRAVRQKASAIGEKLADGIADARTTAGIKTRLAVDPDLSALVISVSTADGVVILSGKVASPEQVGKAMLLALETDRRAPSDRDVPGCQGLSARSALIRTAIAIVLWTVLLLALAAVKGMRADE